MIGSTTLPMRLSVGTAQKGSRQAVAGSGTTNMSLLLMAFQPRMEEPSSPDPSLKRSSVNSLVGMLKCCHVPMRSTNFKSTIWTLCFFTNSNTSRTFIPLLLSNHPHETLPPLLGRFRLEKILDGRFYSRS